MNDVKYDELATAEYYDNRADTYDDVEYGSTEENTPNRVRLQLTREILASLPKGRVLDAGCGSGQFMTALVLEGFDPIGCDLSPGMVKRTKEKLAAITPKDIPVHHCSLDKLHFLEDASIDHVFSLGVFPYIPEDVERHCYTELRRVIRPGGYFVTAHGNELFDTFTFNRYTLRFFSRNIIPLLSDLNPRLDEDRLLKQLGCLITNPEKPVSADARRSGRDVIFMKPENPITYPSKLSTYGFTNREFLYYNFHALPPLLGPVMPELADLSRQMEVKFARHWQGMFMASTFISVAQATSL